MNVANLWNLAQSGRQFRNHILAADVSLKNSAFQFRSRLALARMRRVLPQQVLTQRAGIEQIFSRPN